MGALGANLGASFQYGALQIAPHFTLDAMTMREEGYSEANGGDGFDLAVAPYYANSLRGGAGVDFSAGLNLSDFALSPEARIGYRYDLANSPVKLKAGFASTGGLNTPGNTMTFVGPDPDTGNLFGGVSLGASTANWQLGINFDMLRGNNGSTTQVGTLTLAGPHLIPPQSLRQFDSVCAAQNNAAFCGPMIGMRRGPPAAPCVGFAIFRERLRLLSRRLQAHAAIAKQPFVGACHRRSGGAVPRDSFFRGFAGPSC